MSILSNYTNVTEAAKTLGVHRETIKRLYRSGRIPAEKVHNTWLIAKNDLSVFATSYNGPETWEKKDLGPRS